MCAFGSPPTDAGRGTASRQSTEGTSSPTELRRRRLPCKPGYCGGPLCPFHIPALKALRELAQGIVHRRLLKDARNRWRHREGAGVGVGGLDHALLIAC